MSWSIFADSCLYISHMLPVEQIRKFINFQLQNIGRKPLEYGYKELETGILLAR